MSDDDIGYCLKYRNRPTGIPRYLVTSSIVDNFCKNTTVRIVCSALADSLSRNCVLMILYVNFLPLDVVVESIAGIYVGVLMYGDNPLLISSTCSDSHRMLRTVFSKPTVYNTVTFNTAVFFWYRYTAHPLPRLMPRPWPSVLCFEAKTLASARSRGYDNEANVDENISASTSASRLKVKAVVKTSRPRLRTMLRGRSLSRYIGLDFGLRIEANILFEANSLRIHYC